MISERRVELPCWFTYDKLQEELNKIKSKLPKSEWKNIQFEVETYCDATTDWLETNRFIITW